MYFSFSSDSSGRGSAEEKPSRIAALAREAAGSYEALGSSQRFFVILLAIVALYLLFLCSSVSSEGVGGGEASLYRIGLAGEGFLTSESGIALIPVTDAQAVMASDPSGRIVIPIVCTTDGHVCTAVHVCIRLPLPLTELVIFDRTMVFGFHISTRHGQWVRRGKPAGWATFLPQYAVQKLHIHCLRSVRR